MSFLRSCTPPVLFRFLTLIKKRLFSNSKISGYENPKLVKSIVEKTLSYRQRIAIKEFQPGEFPVIAAVGLIRGHDVTVLDFGGGSGGHGLVAKQAFSESLSVNWNVVETKMMTLESIECNPPNDVNFFPSIKECLSRYPRIDLVFSNSAIQYTRNPAKIVGELVETKAQFIVFTRTPLTEGDENLSYMQTSWLLDNGPGIKPVAKSNKLVEYECNLLSKSNFLKLFESRYELLFSMDEGFWDSEKLKRRAKTYTFAYKLKTPA